MSQVASSALDPVSNMRVMPPSVRNDFLSIVRRRISVFGMVGGAVYVAVLILLYVIPARYVATGSIIVAEQTANIEAGQPLGADKIGDPADLESQILLIRAPRLVHTLIDRPDVRAALNEDCELRSHGLLASFGGAAGRCDTLFQDAGTLIEQLTQRYTVSAAGRSRVINISFESLSPSVAQTLANALTTGFLDDRRKSWANLNNSSAKSLKLELEQLSQSIRQDEERIRGFRNQNGLIRGSIAPIGSERLSDISQKLIIAEAAKADAAARLDEVLSASKTNLARSPTVMSSRVIGDLVRQLNDLETEIARTSALLGPRHPTMVSLESARVALKARINLEMQGAVELERRKLETATALTESLRKRMLSFETDAETAEDQEASISYLIRDLETKKSKYEDLSKQIARLETSAPAFSDTTRLVSLAELPTSPYFPKRPPFLIGGLVLALLLGGGAALMAERLDGRVLSPTRVRAASSLPVLGKIPRVSASWFASLLQRRSSQVDVLRRASTDPGFQSALGDIVAKIATNRQVPRLKTIALASVLPQDGRTVTTIALGHALAVSGRRTLVLECDFQNPMIAEIFQLGQVPGLSAVLQGDVSCEAAVAPTNVPNLFVLPAGRQMLNAAPALASARMTQVLRWAQVFDFVVIDTPAITVSRDTLAFAKNVDAVICCVRSGSADEGRVGAVVADVISAGGRVLGTIATMVDVRASSLSSARQALNRQSGVTA